MMESSSKPLEYFKVLEGPYHNETPCLPDKEMIIEIPQNLPKGTLYDIGLQQDDENIPVGERLNTINQKLNNIIEINSLLLLKQIPDLLQNINQTKQLLKNIQKTQDIKVKKEPLTIKPPFKW